MKQRFLKEKSDEICVLIIILHLSLGSLISSGIPLGPLCPLESDSHSLSESEWFDASKTNKNQI